MSGNKSKYKLELDITTHQEKDVLTKMLRAGEKTLDFHTTQQRKFNSKWNVDLNVKKRYFKIFR